MRIDWDKFIESLDGDPDWEDAADLSRLGVDWFRANQSDFRRDISEGKLRLSGQGISGNSGSVVGVAEAMHQFQRLILATGMSLAGQTSIRGKAPQEIVEQTRLNLNGSPEPGSLVLTMVPAMSPEQEISPTGQMDLLERQEDQVIDKVMNITISLIERGKRISLGDGETDEFLSILSESGPRVAAALRDFSLSLYRYQFEPTITWLQPRRKKLTSSLSIADLDRIGQIITSSELEREPTVVRGIIRTVSDMVPWQIETQDEVVVKVIANQIPKAQIETLSPGMLIEIKVLVTEVSGPASEITTNYLATSFEVIRGRD